MPHLPVIVLTGPTAVGKTSLSIKLAQALQTEIISADSRQIYRELTIGTAKPSSEELASVPHHLIDELHLTEPYSAGIFANEATRLIDAMHREGKIPLIVGGSTLYLHALHYGLSDIPVIEKTVRAELQQRLATEGLEALYHELTLLDPHTARTLDPRNTQRVLRALEVYYGTGSPLSSFHSVRINLHHYDFLTYVLFRDRKELYARINARVDEMIARGLEDEVKSIIASGINTDMVVLKTIGYKEMIAHLMGDISRAETLRLIKRNTRRYAKRQLTWFRRYPSFTWIDASENHDSIIEIIMQDIKSFICQNRK
ncbi:tRNA (adenosine(37)-N6)-dimethylallyltransferase MiaA [Rhodocaloribacter sp.]